MEHISYAVTDIGIKKEVNQDSVLVKSAVFRGEALTFAAVCDGLGGLSDGEKASSAMCDSLASWFGGELREIISDARDREDLSLRLQQSLSRIINRTSDAIRVYGEEKGIQCGTTLAGILMYRDFFLCVNIGDSRGYLWRNGLHRITRDQTYCQREIDAGRMTEAEALVHPRRSMLLQCIGAGENPNPVFSRGTIKENDLFMICSDGFRHKITEEEFEEFLNPENVIGKNDMKSLANSLVALNKERKEPDNISVIMIKTVRF